MLHKFLNKMKCGLLRRINRVSSLSLDGVTIRVPILGGVDPRSSYHAEPFMAPLLHRLHSTHPGAFLDVGVNLGQTLVKVKALFPEKVYVGFEPNPVCYVYARELIKANGFRHCQLFPVGLAEAARVVPLIANDDTDSAASVVEGFREDAPNKQEELGRQFVPLFGGDYLVGLLRLDSLGVVKIDVEGAEWDVIQGLRETLRRHYPYVVCEILPVYDEATPIGVRRKLRQDHLLGFMRELNYSLHRILLDGNLIALDQIETHGDLALCQYLFAPPADLSAPGTHRQIDLVVRPDSLSAERVF